MARLEVSQQLEHAVKQADVILVLYIVMPVPRAQFGVLFRRYVGRCRYDFNQSLLTSYNAADRTSGFSRYPPAANSFARCSSSSGLLGGLVSLKS